MTAPPPPAADEGSGCWSRAGVGCLTLVAGWFSGAMAGVLVLKAYAFFARIPNCEGLPVPCNWNRFAFGGAVLGAVTLPALALWRLRGGAAPATRPPNDPTNDPTDRG